MFAASPRLALQLWNSAGLTCLSLWTQAGKGGHTVDAGGPRSAGSEGAVVDVLAAVISAPAVHAHAGVASIAVGAGASILARIGLQQTLVHIFRAELPLGGGYWVRTPMSPMIPAIPAPV